MSKKQHLDLFLSEIYKSYIAIKDDEYKKNRSVFESVFEQVKKTMNEQCEYFKTYSSQVLFAGSVYDNLKVTKLDEFDMDIVIRLPINYEEIIIEPDIPGYVKLKITDAFDNLDKQQHWEKRHKVTRDWRDCDKYFLQSKFRHWLHSIVHKAVNTLKGKVTVNGVTYLLMYKESGPAFTLNVRNDKGNELFYLDVDLVPVIRFMHPRWPKSYRTINNGNNRKGWFVVPKPNKAVTSSTLRNRLWRLSFMEHEASLIKGRQQLKNIIRLLKKLRDNLGMKSIASYYIKTLFLWKVDKEDDKFWQQKLTQLFRIMVSELHDAVKDGTIKYFWHEKNNLIENVKGLQEYAKKLEMVIKCIDDNDGDKVASFLLSPAELHAFKESEFYKKNLSSNSITRSNSHASLASNTSDMESALKTMQDKMDAMAEELRCLKARVNNIEVQHLFYLNPNSYFITGVSLDSLYFSFILFTFFFFTFFSDEELEKALHNNFKKNGLLLK